MSFSACYGQNRAIIQLQRARTARRIPHSYIFHGPKGIGKSLLAQQWASLILCDSPKTNILPPQANFSDPNTTHIDDSCDQCHQCHLVKSYTHPDLHLINRDSARFTSKKRDNQILSLPIDVIREHVIDIAGTHPAHGKARVFIIDEAHTMQRQAQNALLKTLEEPPQDTFIILITSEPDMFLQTIHSRCQPVRFDPLPPEFITERLIAADENLKPQHAQYWAQFSEGSLGKALILANMGLYHAKCDLLHLISTLTQETALTTADWIVKQAKTFADAYMKLHPHESKSDATRQGYMFQLQFIAHALTSTIHYNSQKTGFSTDQPEIIANLARQFDPIKAGQAIRAIHQAEKRLRANVNPTLIFESILLEYIDL